MCGRFAMTAPLSTLVKKYKIEQCLCDIQPGYNIAPGRDIAAIVEDNTRRLVQFRWGLIPHWSKDPAIGSKMINARAETVNRKPSFKKAFQRQRCLIIVSGFYEWKKTGKEKTPYYIKIKSAEHFCLAGLYDFWVTPEGNRLGTCAIITTEAGTAVKSIHNRMPVIIKEPYHRLWLDCSGDESIVLPLLKPYENNGLDFYPVSTQVNSPANDTPDCLVPVDRTQ